MRGVKRIFPWPTTLLIPRRISPASRTEGTKRLLIDTGEWRRNDASRCRGDFIFKRFTRLTKKKKKIAYLRIGQADATRGKTIHRVHSQDDGYRKTFLDYAVSPCYLTSTQALFTISSHVNWPLFAPLYTTLYIFQDSHAISSRCNEKTRCADWDASGNIGWMKTGANTQVHASRRNDYNLHVIICTTISQSLTHIQNGIYVYICVQATIRHYSFGEL